MKCPKCGSELPKNAPQCPACGTGIVRGKYCPHCRALIPADAQTCPQCKKAIPAPRQKKPLTKRWWFWTVAAVLVLGIIGNVSSAINGGNGPQPEPSPSPASSLLETNPFLQPKVQVADVMNGVRTEKPSPTPSPEPTSPWGRFFCGRLPDGGSASLHPCTCKLGVDSLENLEYNIFDPN